MLPVGDDDTARRTVPLVTYALIALNILFFFVEQGGGDAFVGRWAFVPRRFLANPSGDLATLFTSMFMHAGWLHLGGNMLYLWIFGDNVEDRFGPGKFIIFYLLCGLGATFAQLAFSLGSNVPNPTRSLPERMRRFTTTWRMTSPQLPSCWVMRYWKVLRQNGHMLPVPEML